MDVAIKDSSFKSFLLSPHSKLGLHLPHPVHSQDGKAQFYSERQELEVTLPMNRLMDQINLQRWEKVRRKEK